MQKSSIFCVGLEISWRLLTKVSFVTITGKNNGTDSIKKKFLNFLKDSWEAHFCALLKQGNRCWSFSKLGSMQDQFSLLPVVGAKARPKRDGILSHFIKKQFPPTPSVSPCVYGTLSLSCCKDKFICFLFYLMSQKIELK